MTSSVAIVAVLLILGQAIVFLASPALTRLYSPNEFGDFAIYLSVVYIVGSFASIRFDKLVIVESVLEDKFRAFFVSIICSACISITAWVLLSFCGLYELVFSRPLTLYDTGVVAFSIFFYSAFQSAVNIQVSIGKSRGAAVSKLFQLAVLTLLQLGLFFILSSNCSLAAAYLLSLVVSLIFTCSLARSSFSTPKKLLPYFKNKITKGVLGASSNTLNVMSVQIIPILVTAFFNPYLAGIYALAHRLTAAPMSILSQSMGQVFSPSLRDNLNSDPIRNARIVVYVILLNFVIFSFLFALLFVIGKSGFSFVFGPEWEASFEITLYLLMWMFSSSVVSPLSFIAIAKEKEVQNLCFQVAFLVGRFSSLYVGWNYDDMILSFVLLTSFSVVLNFAYFYYLLSLTGLGFTGSRAFWRKKIEC